MEAEKTLLKPYVFHSLLLSCKIVEKKENVVLRSGLKLNFLSKLMRAANCVRFCTVHKGCLPH